MTDRIAEELAVLQAMKAEQDAAAEHEREKAAAREQHAALMTELTPEQLEEFHKRMRRCEERVLLDRNAAFWASLIALLGFTIGAAVVWNWPGEDWAMSAPVAALIFLIVVAPACYLPTAWWPRWPWRRP